LAVRGTPRRLPPDASLTLYRAAQEALTNASRHAPGATVQLVLSYAEHDTALVVVDQQGGEAACSPDSASATAVGYGLVGMHERAELAGGTMKAGPSGDGWRVEVRVPT
ncbi:MAG: sensor histidine kinase, partial [Acidimicrobiales bacterium]